MRPPGELDELGEKGRAKWSAHVDSLLGGIVKELKEKDQAPQGVGGPGGQLEGVRTIEWPAFPVRIAAELGTRKAMTELDRRDPEMGDIGRADQEEYLEWRLIRRDGTAVGIEMTTELRDYWGVLAAHEPRQTLALAGEFAGGDPAPAAAVYGMSLDEVLTADAQERQRAFARTMLPGYGKDPRGWRFSRYNDGRTALCCMVQKNNDLSALLTLVLSAARPLLVEDRVTGQPRYPSGSEAISALGAAAQDGRNSDPLIVERVVRFVSEERRVGFDDPVGVYIGQLQLHELVQPDGEDVPESWVDLTRGVLATDAGDGRSRAQRLKLELPDDTDFSLADLTLRRSGEGLRFGGQLAGLVELCAYVRTGSPRAGDR